LVEQRGQLSLLDNQIKTNEKYLDIITLKFRRGQVSATDVLQQRQLVESTIGERILVESSLRVLEHQLAILVGRPPLSLDVPAGRHLPALPPMPEAGLPAEWVRRRPDVRSAEIRIRSADRRLAAAIADQFPEVRLTAGAETSAEELRDLFDNWLANLAANLVAPLFDAGQRRAEVERTRAVLSEQLNSYGQLVLDSLKETEDALIRETKQAQYVTSLQEQLRLSGQATDQTLENYTKGSMDFTRYLTTLLSDQRLQRTYLQARRELILQRIALYRALAGGWPLPSPPRAQLSDTDQKQENREEEN
jgi:outer membrane protein TolC